MRLLPVAMMARPPKDGRRTGDQLQRSTAHIERDPSMHQDPAKPIKHSPQNNMAHNILMQLTFIWLASQAWPFAPPYNSFFLRSAMAKAGWCHRTRIQADTKIGYLRSIRNVPLRYREDMLESWKEQMKMSVVDEIPRFGVDSKNSSCHYQKMVSKAAHWKKRRQGESSTGTEHFLSTLTTKQL